jgi:hypothetical protein
MYVDRLNNYKKLEELRGSKLLVYVTGDRPGLETQIHTEILDYFGDHLDTFNLPNKISLYLYSRGGDTLAGWSIVNLIRHFCDDFEVIVPSKAQSTATLISISANKIVMTKQATLGPIDPSVNSPLNPQIPGAPPNARLPISVEAVAGYFELAKQELKIKSEQELAAIFLKLSDQVHSLALGNVYRARTQIQRLAEKLLKFHMSDENKIKKIISVLCSESGSHDYTINRREAQNELFLPVDKPNDELYELIKNVHVDIRKELELNSRYDPNVILGNQPTKNYSFTRALLESISGGSHKYKTEGVFSKAKIQTQVGPVDGINDQRNFEGWIYEEPK